MRSPLVTILILNWNGISYTKKCIKSLFKLTYPNFQIIVLDNGSKSNEAQILEQEFAKKKNLKHKIKVIKKNINVGYARGMNEAFRYAKGKYVMIANNDMVFEHDCLTKLVEVMEKNVKVAIAQPKLKHLIYRDKFDYAVAAGGYMDLLGYPFARGRVFTNLEKDKGQYDKIAKITWCGIFLGRTVVLKRTALFDPIYVNYDEDRDLCYRVYGAGHIIVNVPNAIGYHFGGGALKKNIYKKMYFHHRNNLIFIIKNFETKWLLSIILIRIMMDWIAIGYYLSNLSVKSALAVLHAHVSMIALIPRVLQLRAATQKKLNSDYMQSMPLYRGSIVLDYFILKKRKFTDLSIYKDKSIYNLT